MQVQCSMNKIDLLPLPPVECFIDFDGTISLEDTTDLLLAQFAEPEWRTVEAAWERGAIGSRECMMQQVELLRVEPVMLDLFAGCLRIDPGFVRFVEALQATGISVTIVSDGLDRVIAHALKGYGLGLPVLANELIHAGGNRWQLGCPHASTGCRASSAHCKCASFDRAPDSALRVLIGDGRSDFCAASIADMVFAKGKLADHCRANRITYRSFGNFTDLPPLFSDWLANAMAVQSTHLL